MKVGDKIICKKYYSNHFAGVEFNIGDYAIIIDIYISKLTGETRYEISNDKCKRKSIAMNEIRFDLFFKNINAERVKKLKKLNDV